MTLLHPWLALGAVSAIIPILLALLKKFLGL